MQHQRKHPEQDRLAPAEDALGHFLQTQLPQRRAMGPAEIDQLATRCLRPAHLMCTGSGLDIAH